MNFKILIVDFPSLFFQNIEVEEELEKYLHILNSIYSNKYSLSKERGDLNFKILIINFLSIFFQNVEVEEELEKYLHILNSIYSNKYSLSKERGDLNFIKFELN